MKTFTKEQIQSMNEADLRKLVLIPLLKKLGHQDVEEYHGTSELGMDIVSWKPDEDNNRKNWAVVAKALKVSGKAGAGAGNLSEIQTQILQCIGGDYPDPRTAETRTVGQVLVVSNQPSRREFVAGLRPVLRAAQIEGKIEFWNLDALWDLYNKHVVSIQGNITELLERSSEVDSHYRLEYGALSPNEVEIRVVPKYAGAEKDKPITFSMRFENPEDEVIARAVEEMLAKGTPMEIPAKHLSWDNLPQPLQEQFDALKAGTFQVSTLPDPNLPDMLVKVNILADDGEAFDFDTVRLKVIQQGTEQVVLANDVKTQSLPLSLELTLSKNHGHLSLTYHIDYPMNAFQLQRMLALQLCLSKPFQVNLIEADTGLKQLGTLKSEGVTAAPDPDYLELVQSLALVQRKIGRPIVIPDREWTPEERMAAGLVNAVVQYGGYLMEWSSLVLTWRPSMAARVSILHLTRKEGWRQVWFRSVQQDAKINLFETEIPLGRVQNSFHAKIANDRDLLRWLYLPSLRGVPFDMQLLPGRGDAVFVQFPDWEPIKPLQLPHWFQ